MKYLSKKRNLDKQERVACQIMMEMLDGHKTIREKLSCIMYTSDTECFINMI